MRCVALAQAWRRGGGQCLFAGATLPQAVMRRLERERFPHLRLWHEPGSPGEAAEVAVLAAENGAQWVALDGYHFAADYEASLCRSSVRVLRIDDYAQAAPYSAEIVLDQNLGTTAAAYSRRDPRTRLLLGAQFALIREEFLTLHPTSERESVLLTLGGSTQIESIRDASIRTLQSVAKEVVVASGNEEDMAILMSRAVVAVSGAGVTSWELAYMGVPAVLIQLAANQRNNAQALAAAGAAIDLGSASALTPLGLSNSVRDLLLDGPRREKMAAAGRSLIDGRGADRVVKEMIEWQA